MSFLLSAFTAKCIPYILTETANTIVYLLKYAPDITEITKAGRGSPNMQRLLLSE